MHTPLWTLTDDYGNHIIRTASMWHGWFVYIAAE